MVILVAVALTLALTVGPTAIAFHDDAFNRSRALGARKLPVVYVYTVVPAVCKYGLPEYIRESLLQATFSQPDSEVILVSNFAECREIDRTVDKMDGVTKIDSGNVSSARTEHFANISRNIFESDYGNELWLTSALRFFIIEDMMRAYGYDELVHVEADNLLYGRLTSILSILRNGYKGIAATPLTANKSMVTASVFWIAKLASLVKFNDYMMDLGGGSSDGWKNFLYWLRRYACCKKGGVDPDSNGMGIKPFAINEMSMLAYYHEIDAEEFLFFPVAPVHDYIIRRPFCNRSQFGPNGQEVGPPTGHGVWDPNSWGQFIGGTARKKGRDKGFTDMSHIAGQAIRLDGCRIEMVCDNGTSYSFPDLPHSSASDVRATPSSSSDSDGDSSSSDGSHSESDSKVVGLGSVREEGIGGGGWLRSLRENELSPSSHEQSDSPNETTDDRYRYLESDRTRSKRTVIIDNDPRQLESSTVGRELSSTGGNCFTAPFVRCSAAEPWTPLWNLHVHSKHTLDYRSRPCECGT